MRSSLELAAILRNVADKIEDGTPLGNVFDSNGNIVGHFRYVAEAEHIES